MTINRPLRDCELDCYYQIFYYSVHNSLPWGSVMEQPEVPGWGNRTIFACSSGEIEGKVFGSATKRSHLLASDQTNLQSLSPPMNRPIIQTRTDTETSDHDTDHAARTIPFSDCPAVSISVVKRSMQEQKLTAGTGW